MWQNFAREIEYLLEEVPDEQWKDSDICGVVYDFMPWHESSTITIQTRDDRIDDLGGWKYYYSAEGGSLVKEEMEIYQQSIGKNRFAYHKLLLEAAEGMLSVDFTKYGFPEIVEDFRLYGPFRVQVYDPDERYRFNYCELILAQRLDQALADGLSVEFP